VRVKDFVKLILRKTKLIGVADYILFHFEIQRAKKSNAAFFLEKPGYKVPPRNLAFDAYNHVNWKEYHETGLAEAKGYAGLFKKYVSSNGPRFLEWGCGPARLIRHFPSLLQINNASFYGTDYNPQTIEWCSKNIEEITFVQNKLNPPLPFENDFFDYILARSVFTHLSESLHFSWIAELFRILKPEGVLVFTTHGETFKERLTPYEKQLYISGKLIIRGDSIEGKKTFIAIQSPDFIRNSLLSGHKILEFIPGCSFSGPAQYEQDLWVVQK
jgi:SAM-dependent methyltransferase